MGIRDAHPGPTFGARCCARTSHALRGGILGPTRRPSSVKGHQELPLVIRADAASDRTAIVATEGAFDYGQLLETSHRVATSLLAGHRDLEEERVAYLVPPGWHYVAMQWGIWRAGGIAVPLAVSHPPPELKYVIHDADAGIVVAHPALAERVEPSVARVGARFATTSELMDSNPAPLPTLNSTRRALMVYTSGTTGRAKGVITTHDNIAAQVTALVEAWGWEPSDRILLALPLHHVHGIINVLTCALWVGATCEILPRFEADVVLDRLASGELTLFMGVPTIYQRLIAAWEQSPPERQRAITAGCRRMRLMVSGSAALPVSTLDRWREISTHGLLERYGMTEIGMALSQPLTGERVPGTVGTPLPSVEVRLVDDHGSLIVTERTAGEIEVRGPTVFREYWQRPEATAAAFHDGWFRTGDLALVEDGNYRILGRASIDIIKTGGFKVSALEIEEVLRAHPAIAECAVVAVPDPEWGERICVAVEQAANSDLTIESLQLWAKERLAPYKVPRQLFCVQTLPRNALGKVMKPEVVKLFQQ